VLRHKSIFNGAAIAAASGFILSACLAIFLIVDYRIDAGNRLELMRTGKRAEGTIVGFEHVVERGRGGRSRDCPIVQYVPSDGVGRNIAVLESHCSDRANGRDLPLHVTVTYLETGTAIAKVLDWHACDPTLTKGRIGTEFEAPARSDYQGDRVWVTPFEALPSRSARLKNFWVTPLERQLWAADSRCDRQVWLGPCCSAADVDGQVCSA